MVEPPKRETSPLEPIEGEKKFLPIEGADCMSKFAIITMKKFKSGNLTATKKHNKREFENPGNKNIDPTRTHLNIHLEEYDSLKTKIKEIIDKNYTVERKYRSDAIMMNSFVISASAEYMDTLSREQQIDYFKTAKKFMEDRYQHIALADCHFDEDNPHMHLGVVPLIEREDGKVTLSSKRLFNLKELYDIQEEFPKHMQEHGFDVERGIKGGKRIAIKSIEEYKRIMEKLEKEIYEKTEPELRELYSDITALDKKGFIKKHFEITPQQKELLEEKLSKALHHEQIINASHKEKNFLNLRINELEEEVDEKDKTIEVTKVNNEIFKEILVNLNIPEKDIKRMTNLYKHNQRVAPEVADHLEEMLISDLKDQNPKLEDLDNKIADFSGIKDYIRRASDTVSFKDIDGTFKDHLLSKGVSEEVVTSTFNVFNSTLRKGVVERFKEKRNFEYNPKDKGYYLTNKGKKEHFKELTKSKTRDVGHSR